MSSSWIGVRLDTDTKWDSEKVGRGMQQSFCENWKVNLDLYAVGWKQDSSNLSFAYA